MGVQLANRLLQNCLL